MRRAMAWQALGAFCTALVSFALVAYLGRALGSEDFGDYIAILSAAVVLLVPIEGGWPARVYRDAAGRDDTVGRGLAAGGLAHILAIGVLLTLSLGLVSLAWAAAMSCMTLVAAMNLVSARMRAQGAFRREALWQLAGRLTSAVLIVAAIQLGPASPVSVFSAWAAGLLLVLALGARRWLPGPRWAGGLTLALPFMLVEAFLATLMKGDVALLRATGAGGEALSFYAACTRLNEVALLAMAPVGNVLLRSFRLERNEPGVFARLWKRAAAAFASGAVLLAGAWVAGDSLMPAIFGDAYRPAGLLLPCTAAMLPFALPNAMFAVALLARGDERWLAGAFGTGAAAMMAAIATGWSFAGGAGAGLGVAAVHAAVAFACFARLQAGGPVR